MNSPIISDAKYDQIKLNYKLENDYSFLKKKDSVQNQVGTYNKKILKNKHSFPLSLSNTFNSEGMKGAIIKISII